MFKETFLPLRTGKIAAKIWHEQQTATLPILALHGWLDNAATFDNLAPYLPDHQIVAIDFIGHGHSDHKSAGEFIRLVDFVVNTVEAANYFGWKKFILLGHSLGAAVASIVAGTLPERIQALALIDGIGPLSTPAEHAPLQLRAFIEDLENKPVKTPPRYADPAEALTARLKVTPMEQSSGKRLIERGTKQLQTGEWTWRTDPRLLMPPALQLTEEQVLVFLSAITAPVCAIRPEPGYPFTEQMIQGRLAALRQVALFKIPGEHHVHLDDPESVAMILQVFFKQHGQRGVL